jgi:hypothetical protein
MSESSGLLGDVILKRIAIQRAAVVPVQTPAVDEDSIDEGDGLFLSHTSNELNLRWKDAED